MVDSPVTVTQEGPQNQHQKREYIGVGRQFALIRKALRNGSQNNESIDHGEDEGHHKELLLLVSLVEHQNRVVAYDDSRVSEER